MLEVDLQKHFLIIGGAIGFILTFFVGIYADNEIAIVLQNASIGCLVCAILAKFIHWVIIIHRGDGGSYDGANNSDK